MATAPRKKRIEVLRYEVDAARSVNEVETNLGTTIVRPPIGLGRSSSAVIVRYAFNQSLRVSINHGMNTDRFCATLRDLDGNQFFARVHSINLNEIIVYLTEAMSGYVDVIFDAAATEVIHV